MTETYTNAMMCSNISPVSTLYLLLPPQSRRGKRRSRKTGKLLSLKKKSILRQGHSSDIKRHPTILRDKPAIHVSARITARGSGTHFSIRLSCSRGAEILQACPPSLHRGLNPVPDGSEEQQLQDQHGNFWTTDVPQFLENTALALQAAIGGPAKLFLDVSV